jgi:hypothetical protein
VFVRVIDFRRVPALAIGERPLRRVLDVVAVDLAILVSDYPPILLRRRGIKLGIRLPIVRDGPHQALEGLRRLHRDIGRFDLTRTSPPRRSNEGSAVVEDEHHPRR